MVADNRKRLLVLVDLLLKNVLFRNANKECEKWKMNKRQM